MTAMVGLSTQNICPLHLVEAPDQLVAYRLGVARGTWIEYALVGADLELLSDIEARSGDHLGLEVVGIERQVWRLDGADVAVEQAAYDVYVNDHLMQRNTPFSLGPAPLTYPISTRFWQTWQADSSTQHRRSSRTINGVVPQSLLLQGGLATLVYLEERPHWNAQVTRVQVDRETGVLVQGQCLHLGRRSAQLVLVESNVTLMSAARIWGSR